MGLAIIAIAACFVLGMSYDYDHSSISLVAKDGAILFDTMMYIPVAIALFVAAFSLAMGDIICTYRTNVQNEKIDEAPTYNELVIKSIVR